MISGLSLLLSGAMLLAQQTPPPPELPKTAPSTEAYLSLTFVVKEVEGGKTVNSRSFNMIVGTEKGNQALRTGGRVPYTTGPGQFNYLDVGVNIDCRDVRATGSSVQMYILAEISSVVNPTEGPPSVPTIRQNRWNASVIVPMRKPMVIFSSDDLATKRTVQVEVTASPAS